MSTSLSAHLLYRGFPQYSAGVDFLRGPTIENAAQVLHAIARFVLGSLDISVDDLRVPGKVAQLGYEPNRIDLLTSITGVTFE